MAFHNFDQHLYDFWCHELFKSYDHLGAKDICEFRDDFSLENFSCGKLGTPDVAHSLRTLWNHSGERTLQRERLCIWITRTELFYPFQSIIGVNDVVNGSGSAMDIGSLLPLHHPREYCIVFGRSVIKAQEASFRVLRPKPVLRKIREQEAERKILLPGMPLA